MGTGLLPLWPASSYQHDATGHRSGGHSGWTSLIQMQQTSSVKGIERSKIMSK